VTKPRTARGRQTEEWAAEYYRDRGFPHAERIPASLPGRDINGMPGLAPEVKARRDFNPLKWGRQARKNATGDVPYVILRPDGYGKEQIGDWLVIRRLEDDTEILRLAGYGDTPDDGHVVSS
jgi:hypothetical protein